MKPQHRNFAINALLCFAAVMAVTMMVNIALDREIDRKEAAEHSHYCKQKKEC